MVEKVVTSSSLVMRMKDVVVDSQDLIVSVAELLKKKIASSSSQDSREKNFAVSM